MSEHQRSITIKLDQEQAARMTAVATARGMTLQEHLQDVADTLAAEYRLQLQETLRQPEKLRSGVDEFREVLENTRIPSDPQERGSVDAELCLMSRSAYLDFFADVTVKCRVDPVAQRELDQLFLDAIGRMQEGEYRSVVEARYQEFRDFCDEKSQKISQFPDIDNDDDD